MPHQTRVGNVDIISLLDVGDWTLGNFFPTVPHDIWEEYREIYPDALADDNAILTSATAYAIRTGDSFILVDTGLGPGPHDRIGGQRGQLLAELKASGVEPEDVNLVVFTHLHRDHVGWNAIASGESVQPTFPRARYLLPEKDWAYYRRPEMAERVPHLRDTFKLFERGLLEFVDGEHAIGANVTLFPTPGHTPGHQAVLVASDGERAAIIGDMAHTPPQVQETDWTASADVDADQSRRTRATMFDRIEADHTLLCAGHFPHPGFGYLTRLNGRRLFQAI